MNYELWYTSAPRGLFPGSSGFCTVKSTRGMPVAVRELLESMCHYRHLYPPHHEASSRNPVNFSSVAASIGGKRWYVVSRIQAAGLDHTKRSNFFAHHVAIEAGTARQTCPTKILSYPGLLRETWDFKVEELQESCSLPSANESIRVCQAWRAVAGDAGWAGVVAQRLIDRQKVYVAFQPGIQMLPLVSEITGLLRDDQQWDVTFSTYFTGASQVVDCKLRFVVAGSEEHRASANSGATVLDLTDRLGEAEGGQLVEMARTGEMPLIPKKASRRETPIVEPPMTTRSEPTVRSTSAPSTKSNPVIVPAPEISQMSSGHVSDNPSSPWFLAAAAGAGAALACLILLPIVFLFWSGLATEKELSAELASQKTQVETELANATRTSESLEKKLSDEAQRRESGEDEARAEQLKLRGQHRDALFEREQRIDSLQKEVNGLTEKLAQLMSDGQNLRNEVQRLAEQNASLQKLNAELTKKLKEKESPQRDPRRQFGNESPRTGLNQ